MNSASNRIGLAAVLLASLAIGGCGGTKVLKNVDPVLTTQPLATSSDQRLTGTLDWVIVRGGPGTWAKNADWDEYLVRVSNLTDRDIQVTGLAVIDSLGTRIEPQYGRRQLVKASKKAARRYRDSGLKVKAGRGAGTMLIAGAAVTGVGVGAAYAAAYGSIMTGTAAGAGAATGLLLAGPALAVGGIVRGMNNRAVNNQIELRQSEFPVKVSEGEELALDVFFPLAPSPAMLVLSYVDANGENQLIIDTGAALDGLHLRDRRE